jgi:hypothetical protein
VSLTANAARTRGCRAESEAHAAASYFGRVSKGRIVQAVREGVSDQAAENIARMKKQGPPAVVEGKPCAENAQLEGSLVRQIKFSIRIWIRLMPLRIRFVKASR